MIMRDINIEEKLSTDLDIATFNYFHVDKLSIEPFQEIKVNNRDMIISNYVERIIQNDYLGQKYNYEISCVSLTYKLQRIVLPNKTITKSINEAENRTIYEILERYIELYFPECILNFAIYDKFNDVVSPEFSWQRPTLYEVLCDLFEVRKCIPKLIKNQLNEYVLDLLDTTEITNINETFTITESRNFLENFTKGLEIEVVNGLSSQNSITYEASFIACKPLNDALYTISPDNGVLIVNKPIYEIDRLTVSFYAESTPSGPLVLRTFDITEFCIEKTAYDTFMPYTGSNVPDGNYKRNYIYYTMGSNIIDGLTFSEDRWVLPVSTTKAITNICYKKLVAQSLPTTGAYQNTNDFLFSITYKSIDTAKIKLQKGNTFNKYDYLIDSQSTAYVDLEAFVSASNEKLNKLGNEQLSCYKRYRYEYEIPVLNSKNGDFQLFQRKLMFNENFIDFIGLFSKNDLSLETFNSINSNKRFTQIASEQEASECSNYSIILCPVNTTPLTDNLLLKQKLLDGTFSNGFSTIVANTRTSTFVSNNILLPTTYRHLNNSLFLSYKMQDNFGAGASLIEENTRLIMNHVPYVDSRGEFDYLDIKLYYTFAFDDPTSFEKVRKLPKIENVDVTYIEPLKVLEQSYLRYKDNREITLETLEFRFIGNANIILGKHFLPFVNEFSSLKFFYSATETYNQRSTNTLGTMLDCTIVVDANGIVTVTPTTAVSGNIVSWGLGLANRELSIGMNQTFKDYTFTIHTNII